MSAGAAAYERVVFHEYVHLMLSLTSIEQALWFEEGIAEEIGGGVSVDAGATLDYAAAFGHLIPWKDISDG